MSLVRNSNTTRSSAVLFSFPLIIVHRWSSFSSVFGILDGCWRVSFSGLLPLALRGHVPNPFLSYDSYNSKFEVIQP